MLIASFDRRTYYYKVKGGQEEFSSQYFSILYDEIKRAMQRYINFGDF